MFNADFYYFNIFWKATGFGDPHMITLDGMRYTFNGYGEYYILHVAGPDFQLQGRMQPWISEDGDNTRGTIYKAFVMKENGSDVVQVTYRIVPKLSSWEKRFVSAERRAALMCVYSKWKTKKKVLCSKALQFEKHISHEDGRLSFSCACTQ